MTYLLVTVFFGLNHTHSFSITHTTTWSDLCALITQRTKVNITSLYHNDHQRISNEADWNTLKRQYNSGPINLMTDLELTNTTHARPSVQRDLNASISQSSISFTSQYKRLGELMDHYNDLIQRDEHVRRMMLQTAADLTLQYAAIDWTDLETQLEIKQGDLGSKVPSTRHRSWHHPPSHLAQRSSLKSLVDSPLNIPISDQSSQSGSIWGAYPAYSALHPPPSSVTTPSLDTQQTSPTSLYPSPPPGMTHPSANHEKSNLIRKSTLYKDSIRLAQQRRTDDPTLERNLYLEHHKALKKGQEEEMRHLKRQDSGQQGSTLRTSASLSSLSSSSSSSTTSSCVLSELDVLCQDYMVTSPLKYPSIPSSSSLIRPSVKRQ